MFYPLACHSLDRRNRVSNRPNRVGRYRFLAARALDTRTLPDGEYRAQAEAIDTQGNRTLRGIAFTVANGP